MRRSTGKAACVSAAALLCAAGAALGAAGYPHASGFEGAFNPSNSPWSASGGTVQTDTVLPKGGLQTCIVSNSSLTLSMSPTNNAWFQIWMKPVPCAGNPTVDLVNGGFYVKDTGHLMVYTGSPSWLDAGGGFPTDGNTWVGFAVHVDHANGRWDLYSSIADPNATSLTKVAANLELAGASSSLSQVTVHSEDKAVLDQFAVTAGFQGVFATSPNRVLPYEFTANLQSGHFILPVYSDVYTNGAGQNTLAGALGNDLRAGLTPGDVLSVWTNGWQSATAGIFGWTVNQVVQPLAALALNRAPGSPTTWGFFAYNAAQAVTIAGSNNPPHTYSQPLPLSASGAPAYGFTGLTWPKPLPSGLNDAAFPLKDPGANLQPGDRLYKMEPGESQPREYTWNDGANAWYRSNAPADAPIPPRTEIWLKRTSASVTNVTVSF
jgi:hypothetical protein